MTPLTETWTEDIVRDCFLSAGEDTEAAVLAAQIIVATQPIPMSVESILLAHDISNRQAQGILNRSLAAAKGMSAAARKELGVALKKASTGSGEAILNFIDKYRVQLAKILTQTQIASILSGARDIADKIPTLTDFPGAIPPPPTLEPHEAVKLVERLEGLPPDRRAEEVYKLPAAEQVYVNQAVAARAAAPLVVPPIVPHRTGDDDPDDVHLVTIDEAVRNLTERNVMDRQKYDALEAAARAKAFTVANVAAEETLTKIRDSLAENVREGADYETWRKKIMEDVGQGTFMSDARQETVFRTNVQTGFSDGQESILNHPLVRSGFPYRARDAIHDDRVRHNHLALEKLGIQGTNIYRADDPVWQMFRAPWDYNDRCSDTAMTVRQAAEKGINEAQTWLETGVEPADKAWVKMPDFRPPPGFQRAVASAPMSIQLSMQSVTMFSVDPGGHQHKGKGEGGGQFTKDGSGGSAAKKTGRLSEGISKIKSVAGRVGGRVSQLINRVPVVGRIKSGIVAAITAINARNEKKYGPAKAKAIMWGGAVVGGYGVAFGAGALVGIPGVPVLNDLIGILAATVVTDIGSAVKRSVGLSIDSGGLTELAKHFHQKLASAVKKLVAQHRKELVEVMREDGSAYRLTAKLVQQVKSKSLSLSHDVSNEKRDDSGEWTTGGTNKTHPINSVVKDTNGLTYKVIGHGKKDKKGRTTLFLANITHPEWGEIKEYDSNLKQVDSSTPSFEDKKSAVIEAAKPKAAQQTDLTKINLRQLAANNMVDLDGKPTDDFGGVLTSHFLESTSTKEMRDVNKAVIKMMPGLSDESTNYTETLKSLPVKTISVKGLKPTQPTVEVDKLEYMRDTPENKKSGTANTPPTIVKYKGKHWIFEGHHRAIGVILRGEDNVEAHYLDLDGSKSLSIEYDNDTRSQLIAEILVAMFGDDAEQIAEDLTNDELDAAFATTPVLTRRYGSRPGPNWVPGGTSARGKSIWLWTPPSGATPSPTPPMPVPPALVVPPHASAGAPTPVAPPAPTPTLTPQGFQFTPAVVPFNPVSSGGKAQARSIDAYNNAMTKLASGQPLDMSDKAKLSRQLTNMPVGLLRSLYAALGGKNYLPNTKAAVASVKAIVSGSLPSASAPSTPPTTPAPAPATTPTSTKQDVGYKREMNWSTGVNPAGRGETLNGVDFTSATPKFWESVKDVDVGEPPTHSGKKVDRVSIMVQEPDGRIWIVKPTNEYGERKYTIPGGGVETGLTDQQNALKEIWEETGLQVEITGHLGDFEDSNTKNNGRLYIGKRIGGAPWDAKIESKIISQKTGKPSAESETVTLVTPERAAELLHRTDDLGQLITVNPIKIDTPVRGTGSNPLKKFLDGIAPTINHYKKNKRAAGEVPGNAELHVIQNMRGFNNKPKVVSKNDMDSLISKGDHIELLRGVKSAGSLSAKDLADKFKYGDHFPGHGVFGSGTYTDSTSGHDNMAHRYGASSGGSGIRIAIPKTAKIIKQSELEDKVKDNPDAFSGYHSHGTTTECWQGVQAALAGYDAILVDGKSSRHGIYAKGVYVVLNRSILTVQKEDAKSHIIP